MYYNFKFWKYVLKQTENVSMAYILLRNIFYEWY